MRNFILLAATAASLGACAGAGPETAGSVAVGGAAGPVTATDTHSFVKPTQVKTYEALGAAHHYQYETQSNGIGQRAQLYAGDANTVRDSGISVSYNPRDAIFDIAINRPKAVVNDSMRFQDPAHRTAFGGATQPQAGVPALDAAKQIQYLETGRSSGAATTSAGAYPVGAAGFTSSVSTFFYQKPGTTTQYVTYGGFVDNNISTDQVTENIVDANGQNVIGADGQVATRRYLRTRYDLDRAVFAWGERTDIGAVPRSGTATFTGDMLATMVYNDRLDDDAAAPTYFQWIAGRNTTTVDFGALTVKTVLTGTVTAPTLDAGTSGAYTIAAGSAFAATGAGKIDLAGSGGFTGSFSDARITSPAGAPAAIAIAGSSLDGAFFGPAAQEIGAGFRIVGGTPDQRIDINGVFTGKQ